jgi:hypothetical protein
MTTKFILTRDINGYNGFGLPFSNAKFSATLAITTDTTLTAPQSGAVLGPTSTKTQFIAIFSYEPGAKVWVAINETAASPAGATFAATTSELNPAARNVQVDDVLHFYTTDTTAEVGVVFYELVL